MSITMEDLRHNTEEIVTDVLNQAQLKAGDIFVIGFSSSEVAGGVIGQNSSAEIGEIVMGTIYKLLHDRDIYMAVQGCEHINRALLVESELAERKDLELVNVIPALHAGGSGQLAAYALMHTPVEVEHITAKAGIDIGDTAIGMHIKHVQIPIRPQQNELGGAHVTALTSRPKKIGGARAVHF
ncbi:hypothetical protein IV67_GL000523 [Weissella minor]|uniref:UPF0340 protein IV67_GL000523 n=2 Tax=Weissella minor TaxID=1620 RepID=A0A0R2JI69_9LACO|nr:hypothetical protein IV67_GL000523 [Weissella minor]